MYRGEYDLPGNVRVYSAGRERGLSKAARVASFYRHLLRLLAAHQYDACFAHMMPLFAGLAGTSSQCARDSDGALVYPSSAVGSASAGLGDVLAGCQR